MWDMTPAYVRHGVFIYVRHDSFMHVMCETWLISIITTLSRTDFCVAKNKKKPTQKTHSYEDLQKRPIHMERSAKETYYIIDDNSDNTANDISDNTAGLYKETCKRDLFRIDAIYRRTLFIWKQITPIYSECNLHMRSIYVQTNHITENSYSAAALSTKRHTKETCLHWIQPTHQTYSCENRLYHREFVQCCRVLYKETTKETYLHWMRPTHQTYSCEKRSYHREFVQCCRAVYKETY